MSALGTLADGKIERIGPQELTARDASGRLDAPHDHPAILGDNVALPTSSRLLKTTAPAGGLSIRYRNHPRVTGLHLRRPSFRPPSPGGGEALTLSKALGPSFGC